MARISASRLSAWLLRSLCVAMQVLGDVLHLLGEQRRAVDLEHAQHALHLVQVRHAALEQRHVVGLLDVALECGAGLAERGVHLATDEIECLGSDFRHALASGAGS